MTGAECLLRTLLASGVDTCFMNPGTSEMHFVAALDAVPGMRAVLCLFEGVCSGAADGYARMAHVPAATLLHLGPGLGNALANFHNARKARSAVVNIVGEHATHHLAYDAPLTADIEAFARTVSNAVHTPAHAGDIGPLTAQTVADAVHPPGGVASLLIPADYSWSEAGNPAEPVEPVRRRAVPHDRLARAAELLRNGPRTGVLLSGTALMTPGLRAAARIHAEHGTRFFANRYAARMASGRGRFHPQRLAYFPEPAEAMLAGLDHLLLVETDSPVSFFGYPGRRSTLAPESCDVQVLADEEELGAHALEALASHYAHEGPTSEEVEAPRGPLTAEAVGRVVARLLPEDAIVSDEAISSSEGIWPWLLRAAPHDHLPVTGGSIGQGLPVALGAAVAAPGRKVVALEADGSAMYTLQSLWTIARERLDVTTVILNNGRYRILDVEMHRTRAHGFGPRANDMIDLTRPDIDFVRLSEAMGVEASAASTAEEFASQFEAAMWSREPRLIDARLAT